MDKKLSKFEIRFAALVVVYALLFNAFSPYLFKPSDAGVSAGKVLICTAFGFKYIKADGEEGEVQEGQHCPLCSKLADYSVSYHPEPEFAYYPPLNETKHLYLESNSDFASDYFSYLPNTRAPPVFL